MSRAQGLIVEAFHGTRKAFRSFEPSERGSFGAGIYFGSTLQQGIIFSGEDDDSFVLKVRVSFQRPYFHKIVEPQEIDSWGEGLVKDLLPADVASKAIESAVFGDGQFGREIFDRLECLGHDGIVGTFEDGTQEIIALYPSQCEILERLTLDEVYARHPELSGSPATPRQEACR